MPTISEIKNAVAKAYDLKPSALYYVPSCRGRAAPIGIAMWLCKYFTAKSFQEIADGFNLTRNQKAKKANEKAVIACCDYVDSFIKNGTEKHYHIHKLRYLYAMFQHVTPSAADTQAAKPDYYHYSDITSKDFRKRAPVTT